MNKLPINFSSEALASGDFEQAWLIQSGPVQSLCSIPSEFGGSGGGFSPEDLFLQAIMNCFLGTFKVYAKASRVTFSNIKVKGQLTVDQDESKKVSMKSVFLNIEFDGADRPERIETLVTKTMRDGFILNSVKSDIRYELVVNGHPAQKTL